jgi:WS/DGAT/MGAT family acyltransferase
VGTERLNGDDARILGLETAAITGHTCKVAVLAPREGSGGIEIDDLRRHVAGRLRAVRRCRQRVAFVPLRIAPPVWVDYPDFDIAEHVRPYETDGAVDAQRLREIAAELMAQRLDHTRPLWRMDLVGPLEDGGSAIVWRVHHCMADGVTAMRLGGQILWDNAPEPGRPEPDRWSPEPEPSRLALVRSALAERSGELARLIPSAARAVGAPSRWAPAARSAARVPGALVRELTPLGSDSPMDRHIGSRRELAWATHPLDELKRIEAAARDRIGAHVTINDVVLAAVSGALRSWLGGGGGGELRAQIPVSMHHRDERADALGNRDSFLFVDLPLHEPDPLKRIQLINAETTVRKQAHDADALYAFFHAVSRLGPLGREIVHTASGPREFSLSVSNVPGPRDAVYVIGRPVRELCSVAEPADRHALRVSALSCSGRMHFGLCTDPDALGGLAEVEAGLDAAIEELRERC